MSKKNQQQAEQVQAKTTKPEIQGLETAVVNPIPSLQRAYADPRTLSPADAKIIQHTIGNQALRRLSIQRKMTLGPVGDKYEQEADAVAKQVVGIINTSSPRTNSTQTTQRQEDEEEVQMKPLPTISTLQRQEDEEEIQMFADSSLQRHAEEDLQMSPLVQRHESEDVQMTSLVQRQEEDEALQMSPLVQKHDIEDVQMKSLAQRQEEDEEVQMRADSSTAQGGEITSEIEQSIQNGRSGGQPLSDPIRQPMENAFNADFSSVRVHTDSNSDAINRSISARAFTTGQDIFFRSGEYNPGSSNGQELLAHELTHTVQQGAAPQKTSIQAKKTDGKTAVNQQANPHKIQRRENQSSLAKIINAGVNVTDAKGNSNQLGHAMDVWVEIDAGAHPVTPANAKPNTVYGLEFEYWEYVNVPHDNIGRIGEKPWNDIHGLKPDASTFSESAPSCDLTWAKAVQDAQAGTLTGRKKIGFRDYPGLYEKLGRDTERTLKFRIVFFDGDERKEIFATQLLRISNGKLGYSAYRDSLGNALESHGFGSDDHKPKSVTEKIALEDEPNRLQATDIPNLPQIKATIPTEAKSLIQGFVSNLLSNKADNYADLELLDFLKNVDADKQKGAADTWLSSLSTQYMSDKILGASVAAGQYLIPDIPGTQKKQMTLPSGGVLVALVTGNNILRMYYTDNSTQNVPVPQKDWTINLRSFTEIPTEMIKNSMSTYQMVSTKSTTKQVPLTGGSNAHLRKYIKQGENYIVQVNNNVGSKIKPNKQISVPDPEIRDITGNWALAHYGGKTGFIRAEKIGAKAVDNWKKDQKAELKSTSAKEQVEKYIKEQFQQQGQSHTVYAQLIRDYGGYADSAQKIYKELFGEDALHKMLLDYETAGHQDIAFLQLLSFLNDQDHDEMVKDVMAHIKNHPGEGDALESVYNQHVASFGYDVPNTLGEIVHMYFVNYFKGNGNGYDIYNQLMTDYPDFDYRLKPAYRLVFGEDQLQTMMQQRQDADFATDVPNPDSLDNIVDYLNFVTHAPFTLQNFEPNVGNTGNKFDVEFDPMTNTLKLIVKVAFEFADGDTASYPISSDADPTSKFSRGQWTDPDKIDYKQRYIASTASVFNSSGIKIACLKPGWTDIVVTPRFDIQEVEKGSGEHFVSKAGKAFLTGEGDKKQMKKGQAGARPGFQAIYESDVHDKLNDPAVHAYLHKAEEEQNVEPAYKLDRQRLENILAQFGTITTPTQVPIRNLIDNLKRLSIPSALAHLHPLLIEVDLADGVKARQISQTIQQLLLQSGVTNPIQASHVDTGGSSVKVKPGAEDPAVLNTYIASWSRLTAAHEFGHMIGLIDEYYEASSAETVKMMISAGLLPPNTRADHLKLNPPKSNMAAQQMQKQKDQMGALKRAGLETPDLAMDAPGSAYNKDPKSTSLMSGGFRVEQQHFLSAWEALVEVTKTHVDEKFWKIT